MAITIKYGLNMALQYNNANEVDIDDYIMETGFTNRLFLTEAPNRRIINIDEKGGLYFLTDGVNIEGVFHYEFKDSSGTVVYAENIESSEITIHNSIPILSPNFIIPDTAVNVTIWILGESDLIINGNFELGTGNDFTSWTENGPVTQTASGGLSGTRGVVFTSGIFDPVPSIEQEIILEINSTYRLSFYAKGISGTNQVQYQIDGTAYAPISIPNTTEYVWHTFTFTTGGTIIDQTFMIGNASIFNGVLQIDRVQLVKTSAPAISEQRTFLIDRICSNNAYQIEWLNKLGGRDTFYFKGNPIVTKEVERTTLMELSKLQNFTSPKRIFGFRQHTSKKTYTLFHRCANKETATWLRDELIDSIDVNILIGDYYYPANIVESTIITENTAEQDRVVSLKFRLGFDVNIQTR